MKHYPLTKHTQKKVRGRYARTGPFGQVRHHLYPHGSGAIGRPRAKSTSTALGWVVDGCVVGVRAHRVRKMGAIWSLSLRLGVIPLLMRIDTRQPFTYIHTYIHVGNGEVNEGYLDYLEVFYYLFS